MIYDIRQSTVCSYASNAAYANHSLRLMPIDRPRQRVRAAVLDIAPEPAERREGHDFFGNRLTWIALDQPHDTFTVSVAARIAVDAPAAVRPEGTPAWEQVREAACMSPDLSAESPAHFLYASRHVTLDPEIRAYVEPSFPPGRPILAGAVDLMSRIKTDFTYEIGATTVTTTPPMSFALRRGVCQDFAHIMISGLRGIGLPAAYVSGYLSTIPARDGHRLEGADAMHAWVQVWCGPDAGWVGLDPTNNVTVGTDHIVLAVGRDYADIAPIDGVVFASGGQRIGVSVSVLPLDLD